MKKNIISAGFLAAGLLLAGCDVNEMPTFDDADAFVAFTQTSASVNENSTETLEIEVLCTSLSGIESEVQVEIEADTIGTGAHAGEHFTWTTTSGGTSLKFDKEHTSHKIIITPIDNDYFAGDKTFTINLGEPSKGNLGFNRSCKVTVADDEHPLAFILGSFVGKGTSDFYGATEWNLTVVKDPEGDLTKVWIGNLVPNGTSLTVYGFVNDEKNLLSIPVGQEIAKSSSYPSILLNGYRGPDGDEKIPVGEFIYADIEPDGTIKFNDYFGSQVFDETSTSLGWYNIMCPDVVLTKK